MYAALATKYTAQHLCKQTHPWKNEGFEENCFPCTDAELSSMHD